MLCSKGTVVYSLYSVRRLPARNVLFSLWNKWPKIERKSSKYTFPARKKLCLKKGRHIFFSIKASVEEKIFLNKNNSRLQSVKKGRIWCLHSIKNIDYLVKTRFQTEGETLIRAKISWNKSEAVQRKCKIQQWYIIYDTVYHGSS